MQQTSYRESHKSKGEDYHKTFTEYPHRKMLWHYEKKSLGNFLLSRFKKGKPSYLDFACGTGRILQHVSCFASKSVGVDISESMLNIAKKINPQSQIILGDISRENILNDEKFDLITAFRFFPNAEHELRVEIINILTKYLNESGVIIFNNHRNKKSLMRKIARLLGNNTEEGMTHKEVLDFVSSSGLKVIKYDKIGVLPLTDNRMPKNKFLISALYLIEGILSHIPLLNNYAQDYIYYCDLDLEKN